MHGCFRLLAGWAGRYVYHFVVLVQLRCLDVRIHCDCAFLGLSVCASLVSLMAS